MAELNIQLCKVLIFYSIQMCEFFQKKNVHRMHVNWVPLKKMLFIYLVIIIYELYSVNDLIDYSWSNLSNFVHYVIP